MSGKLRIDCRVALGQGGEAVMLGVPFTSLGENLHLASWILPKAEMARAHCGGSWKTVNPQTK
jgi:hypothetical protein